MITAAILAAAKIGLTWAATVALAAYYKNRKAGY